MEPNVGVAPVLEAKLKGDVVVVVGAPKLVLFAAVLPNENGLTLVAVVVVGAFVELPNEKPGAAAAPKLKPVEEAVEVLVVELKALEVDEGVTALKVLVVAAGVVLKVKPDCVAGLREESALFPKVGGAGLSVFGAPKENGEAGEVAVPDDPNVNGDDDEVTLP